MRAPEKGYREIRLYRWKGLCDANGDMLSLDLLKGLQRLVDSQIISEDNMQRLHGNVPADGESL